MPVFNVPALLSLLPHHRTVAAPVAVRLFSSSPQGNVSTCSHTSAPTSKRAVPSLITTADALPVPGESPLILIYNIITIHWPAANNFNALRELL